METKTLNLITNIIGFMFMLFGLYLIYAKYDLLAVGFDIFISIGLVFYKGKLYNKLAGRV